MLSLVTKLPFLLKNKKICMYMSLTYCAQSFSLKKITGLLFLIKRFIMVNVINLPSLLSLAKAVF